MRVSSSAVPESDSMLLPRARLTWEPVHFVEWAKFEVVLKPALLAKLKWAEKFGRTLHVRDFRDLLPLHFRQVHLAGWLQFHEVAGGADARRFRVGSDP